MSAAQKSVKTPGPTEHCVTAQLAELAQLRGVGMRLAGQIDRHANPASDEDVSVNELGLLSLAFSRCAKAVRQIAALEQEMMGLRTPRSANWASDMRDKAVSWDRPSKLDQVEADSADDDDDEFDEANDLGDRDDLDDYEDCAGRALESDNGAEMLARIEAELDRIAERRRQNVGNTGVDARDDSPDNSIDALAADYAAHDPAFEPAKPAKGRASRSRSSTSSRGPP